MQHLPGFLTASELTLLRGLRHELHGYKTDFGHVFIKIAPIPSTLEQLVARARRQLTADGATDCFFLHYQHGDATKAHVDRGRLARLIALVDAPESGGELIVSGERANLREGDAVVFCPATDVHEVTPVVGSRLVWSVGIRYT